MTLIDVLARWLLGAGLLLASCSPEQFSQLPPPTQAPHIPTPQDGSSSVVISGAAVSVSSSLAISEGAPSLSSSLSPQPVVPSAVTPVRIALLLPLSGDHAATGKAMLEAALLALVAHPASAVRILPYDTRGTLFGTMEAALQVGASEVDLILGPLFARNAAAIGTSPEQISIVTFSNDWRVATPDIYVLGFDVRQQVKLVTQHALAQGLERFAILAPRGAYGNAILQSFSEQIYSSSSGHLVYIGRYGSSPRSMQRAVSQLPGYEVLEESSSESSRLSQSFPVEQDTLPGAAATAGTADSQSARPDAAQQGAASGLSAGQSAQAPETIPQPSRSQKSNTQSHEGVTERVQSLGSTTAWEFEALMISSSNLGAISAVLAEREIGSPAVRILIGGSIEEIQPPATLVGAWYAGPPPAARLAFEALFTQTYASHPPHIASLAYDAVLMAVALAAPITRDLLLAADGFEGSNGWFRFNPDGTAQRALAILEITSGPALTLIDPTQPLPSSSLQADGLSG